MKFKARLCLGNSFKKVFTTPENFHSQKKTNQEKSEFDECRDDDVECIGCFETKLLPSIEDGKKEY